MTKHKLTKEELKTPDAFLTFSDHLLHAVANHAKTIGGVALAALIIGIGWVAINQWQSFSERRAAAAIYKAESELNKKRESIEREEAKKFQDKLKAEQEKDKGKAKTADTGSTSEKLDFDKTYGDLVIKVEEAIRQNKDSLAASASGISLAGLYLQYKKFDKAQALLEQLKELQKGSTLSALLRAQKAGLAMEMGDYERALAAYQTIVDDKSADFLQPEALVKMGLCYEKLNQADRAKDVYLRVSTEFGESEAGRTAKGYLRLLEMKVQ